MYRKNAIETFGKCRIIVHIMHVLLFFAFERYLLGGIGDIGGMSRRVVVAERRDYG